MKKISLFILTMLFFLMQLGSGFKFVEVLLTVVMLPFQGLPENSANGIMLLGIELGQSNLRPAGQTILVITVMIILLAVMGIQFLLAGNFRHLLENVNDEKAFSENSINTIKKILLQYFILLVANFVVRMVVHLFNGSIVSDVSTSIISGTMISILQLAGIYTLYIVFKEGSRLRLENEEIV